jgi:hypothetical protein
VKLEHGDTASFLFPLDQLSPGDDKIAEVIGSARVPRVAVRAVCAGVALTTGQLFVSPVERDVRDWILKRGSNRAA